MPFGRATSPMYKARHSAVKHSSVSSSTDDEEVGRSLSADELDSNSILRNTPAVIEANGTSAHPDVNNVVSASTSALPVRGRTFAGRKGANMTEAVNKDQGARHTMRGVDGHMDDKDGSLWKRLRNKFRAKAENARGSFRFDRASFVKLVSRRSGNTGRDSRDGGGGGGWRRGNGIGGSSASLRRERFAENVEGGKKKAKRKRSERGIRGLPKRVFSSPPNFPGRGSGRRSRFSRSSGAIDETASDGAPRNPRFGKPSIGRTGVASFADITGSSILQRSTVEKDVAPDKNAANFRRVLEACMAGKMGLKDLLDCMFVLEEKYNAEIKEMLIKYLSKQENMEKLIDMLTVAVPNTSEDPVIAPESAMTSEERVRYRYSYVSCMLLSYGPIQLRRQLFLKANYLDRLINVLGIGTPTDRVLVASVCKVLLSVLRDSPEDTVRGMIRRKDFVPSLLSHISVTGTPEVCLSMLCTVRCQADLKFGSPNKPIVAVLAAAKVQKTLCSTLVAAAESGPIDGFKSATIENCSRCIVGIALRALVIPRVQINDDTPDADGLRKFNEELTELDLFQDPEPIMSVVDAGLRSIYKHDTRGYTLGTALTAIRYILVTAINAQDSSLSSIRMQLMGVSTTKYEEGIAKRIPELARVLESARKDTTVRTMWDSVRGPLGVVRLKIMELLIVLQQHGRPKLTQIMVESGIPRIAMKLFKRFRLNSLCLHVVATLIEQSFRVQNGAMRRAFLIDNNLIDEIMDTWLLGKRKEETRARTPVADQGELLRMIVAIRDFLKQSLTEVQQLKKEIGIQKITQFFRFCEGEVAERLGLESRLLGGIDKLPPRNDDGLSFDDMPGFGGSDGSLYFRARSGAGGAGLTTPLS